MSPEISMECLAHPSQEDAVSGLVGTTSATGRPNRVTRTGAPVRRTSSRTAKHVALNLEIAISRIFNLYHSPRPWSECQVLNRFGGAGQKCAANLGLTPSFRRSLPETGCLFECISMALLSGSPEGYNAETGLCEPAQKPQSGEPNEHQTLYRIRRSQEKHQLLRQDRRRQDHRGRQTAGYAPGAAGVGAEAHGTLARRDGSDAVQQLDLRRAETLCRRAANGEPLDDESHRRGQEEEGQTGCPEDRRPGALQSAPGLLRGSAGDGRSAAGAALPGPGGGAGGAEYSKQRLHGTKYFSELLDQLEEVPESVKDLLRLSRGGLETFAATQRQLLDRLQKDPLLVKRVNLLKSIGGVGEVTALTWALEICDPRRFPSIGDAESYCGLTSALKSSADKQQRGPISKQRNAHLQTVLIEAAKLAPRWNKPLAAVHAREGEQGNRNRATLAVARKLVAYLLAVDKSGQPFQPRTPLAAETEVEKVA